MSMELILNNMEVSLPQSIANLEQLKEELIPKLEKYNNLIVTEDSIKAAKDDKAALNKLKKAIEEQRISIKKQYLEPYNKLEAQCKEVVKLIDEPIQAIDKQIKSFDEIEKQQKYAAIEEAFTALNAPEWVKISDVLNPKWENKTQKLDSLKTEMADSLNKLTEGFDKLSEMYGESPVYLPVINRYKQIKDFSQTDVYAVQLEQEYKREQERKAEAERKRAEAEAARQAESIQNASKQLVIESNEPMPAAKQKSDTNNSEQPEKVHSIQIEFDITKSELIKLLGFLSENQYKFKRIK